MNISIKLYEYSEKLERYYNEKYKFLDSYLLKYLNSKNKQEQYEEVKKKIKQLISKIKKNIKKNKYNKIELIRFASIIYNIFNEIYECNIVDDKKSLHIILVLLKLINKLKEYLSIDDDSECSSDKCSSDKCSSDKCSSDKCSSDKCYDSTSSSECTNKSSNNIFKESEKSCKKCSSSIEENICNNNESQEINIEIKKLLQIILCNFNNLNNIVFNIIKLISAYIIYLENKPENEIIKIFVDEYNYYLKLLIKNILPCEKYKNNNIKEYINKYLIIEILNIDNNFDFLKYDIKIEKQLCILNEYIKKLRCIENLLKKNIEIINCLNIY